MSTQEICAPTNRECVGTKNEGNFVFGKRETEESERKKVESCVISREREESCVIRRWFILVEFWRFRTLQRRRFIAIIGTQTPDFIEESSNRIWNGEPWCLGQRLLLLHLRSIPNLLIKTTLGISNLNFFSSLSLSIYMFCPLLEEKEELGSERGDILVPRTLALAEEQLRTCLAVFLWEDENHWICLFLDCFQLFKCLNFLGCEKLWKQTIYQISFLCYFNWIINRKESQI